MSTTPPSSSSSGPQLPTEVPLGRYKVHPGDEKILDSPFGRMIRAMPGAAQQDQDTLIKEVKAAMNQYCQDIVNQMQSEQKRADRVNEMLKRVAEGQDPDS